MLFLLKVLYHTRVPCLSIKIICFLDSFEFPAVHELAQDPAIFLQGSPVIFEKIELFRLVMVSFPTDLILHFMVLIAHRYFHKTNL